MACEGSSVKMVEKTKNSEKYILKFDLISADERCNVKGYLLIRGLHSREEVLEARKGWIFLPLGRIWKIDIQLCLSTWQLVVLESWSDPQSLEFLTLGVVVDVFLLWREETA